MSTTRLAFAWPCWGIPEAALEEFDKALEISDTYAEAHLNRAIVLQGLGHFEEARRHLRRADELDHWESEEFPSDVGHKIAIAHAKLGDLYLVADHPEEAASEYQKALAVRTRFLDIRSKYAEALMGMGRWKDAQEQLETILENNPGFTSARLRLGLALPPTGRRGRGSEGMGALRGGRSQRHEGQGLSGIPRAGACARELMAAGMNAALFRSRVPFRARLR